MTVFDEHKVANGDNSKQQPLDICDKKKKRKKTFEGPGK